ncbi:hypothetical protein [Acinetobacter thermotolerans]|uniref:hypothetical protein n=1 Tax=Acinetobacter thermotolerans TaxID=3151487 RepID=UPI00325BB546
MKKILTIASACLYLMGCSTAPINDKSVGSIPKDRIYQQDYFYKQSADQASVTFTRDKGFLGSGCSHVLYVNNIKVFSIRSHEKATIYLPPDFYIFRLETGGGMCPDVAISQDAQLKPGTEAEYRILLPSDFSLRLTRIK